MRKIIVEAEISVDGAMDSENPQFWQKVFPFHSPDVTTYLGELMSLPDALLLGRKTYEGFAQVWPTRQGQAAEQINAMPKYVASRTLKAPLSWNATLLEGDTVEAIRALKQQPGKPLLQYGIGELTQTMLKAGLVDEIRLMVFPFTYGAGPHVFQQMGVNRLKLLETKAFQSGAVVHHYQPGS
jgi:dihydrofolate reductase